MRLPDRWPCVPNPGGDSIERASEARPTTEEHTDDAVNEVLTILRLASAVGARPRAALAIVAQYGTGSLARSLAVTVEQLNRGASLDAALRRTDVGVDERVRRVHRLLVISEEDGSSAQRDLEALQRDLRLTRLTELEVGAQRLTVVVQFPVVLCILPAFIILALAPLVLTVLGELQL